MKRYFFTLVLCICASAAVQAQSGTDGNISWSISGSTLTISKAGGTGAMPDYGETGAPWYAYRNSITHVDILTGVTTIGRHAFFFYARLASITIPNSVTTIGYRAIAGCSGLTSVTIPTSVTTLAHGAFDYCEGLTSIIIPSSVTTIDVYAFYYCIGLTDVINLAATPQNINSNVFGNNNNSINIPGKCTLYVPAGSLSNYQNANVWKNFNNIVELGGSVQSVSVTPATASVKKWEMQQFTANIIAQGTATKLVTWKVTGNSSASTVISGNGLLGAGADETAATLTITATSLLDATKSGTATVTVTANNNICSNLTATGFTGNLAWVLCPDGTLTISGTGDMPNYGNGGAPWYQYRNSITSVIIGNSVTTIGNNAFQYCSGLTSITIGNSLTSLNGLRFSDYANLASIATTSGNTAYSSEGGVLFNKDKTTLVAFPRGKTGSYAIPDMVTTIGENAFRNCNGLTSVIIGNSVTTIGNNAFQYCSGLTSITIGNSLTSLNGFHFSDYDKLTSITVASDNTAYSSEDGVLFNKDKTTLVTFPRGKTGSYVILDMVATIGENAFRNCSGLTSVIIGNSVTTIGNSAFQDCSGLTSITIGNSLTSLNGLRFYDYANLASIAATSGNTAYSSEDGVLFNKDKTMLIAFPRNKTGNYAIPDMVATIGENAFRGCDGLNSVNIPNSVINIGVWAFGYCNGLTSVVIPNFVTNIGESSFEGCYGLNSVVIGNSLTTIGNGAFAYCSGLTEVVNLSATPQAIDEYVFNDVNKDACTLYVPAGSLSDYQNADVWKDFHISGIEEVQSITVTPAAVNVQKAATQQFTAAVTTVQGEGAAPVAWKVTGNISAFTVISGNGLLLVGADETAETLTITATSAFDVTKSGTATVTITAGSGACSNPTATGLTGNLAWVLCPDGTLTISGTGAMPNYIEGVVPWSRYREDITRVVIGEGVTAIGEAAFAECYGLTSVTIGNSVTTIGEYAFGGCEGLNSVIIPNSVIAIGRWAFGYCYNLNSVIIGNSVTTIGKGAFSGCLGLTSVTIGNSVTTIGEYAFEYCTSLNSVIIPNSVTTIGNNAFRNCYGLNSVIIGSSVETIGEYAFEGCYNLTEIVNLSATPQPIGDDDYDYVFYDIDKETCKLSVPAAALSLYQEADVWKDFYNISGMEEVQSVTITPATVSVQKVATQQFTAAVTTVQGEGASPVAWKVTGNASGSTVISSNGLLLVGADETAATLTVTATSVLDQTVSGTATVTVTANSNSTPCSNPTAMGLTGNLAWILCPDGTLTISGSGAMPNYGEVSPWRNYQESITRVVISEGVTVIGEGAFYYYESLNSVIMPNSLTTIGVVAFGDCSSLTSITIPNSVITIGEGAFYNCSNLNSVTIGNSVTTIDYGAFYNCSSLAEIINLSATPQPIDDDVFYGVNKEVCTLNVPAAALSLYQEADVWKEFYNTEAMAEVQSVTVTPATPIVQKGQTQSFTATVLPQEAFQGVTWSVANNVSAGTTISASGLLTVAEDETATTFTVTATSSFDDSKSGAATVTIPAVNSVTVTPATASVQKGQTQLFEADVTAQGDASQTVTWSVTGGGEGTNISADGLLTVAANETAATLTVTATSDFDNSKIGAATVTIPAVTSVTVSPATASVQKGQTQLFEANVTAQGGASQTVTWSVAGGSERTSISADGLLTVAANESSITLTVTATSDFDNSKSGAATITIPAVTSVTVSPATATVLTGQTQSFTANVTVQGGASTAVTWSVTGGGEGTSINENGLLIIAVNEAAATLAVRATSVYDNSKYGEAAITVESDTGIDDLALSGLKAYPNPTTGVIRINGAESCTLHVVNVVGATLHTQKITSPDETVHLEKLPAGAYLLRLEKDGKAITVKVIKH